MSRKKWQKLRDEQHFMGIFYQQQCCTRLVGGLRFIYIYIPFEMTRISKSCLDGLPARDAVRCRERHQRALLSETEESSRWDENALEV
jgi:hypothetical protein